MCLYKTKDSKWLVAKKDIVVYKALCISGKGTLTPPYYRIFKYRFGKNICPRKTISESPSRIDGGVLHSSLSLETVLRRFEYYNVFQCIIPKGEKYMIGYYGEVVSKVLIVDSVVKYSKYETKETIQSFEKHHNIIWK